ncbi:MAG: hypothetical protein EBV48_06330 [Betaproteobacteria bacterium]|nr:hypothetical protein [Betaproteobacteria bacterium]
MSKDDDDLRQLLNRHALPQPPANLAQRLQRDHGEWRARQSSVMATSSGGTLIMSRRRWVVIAVIALSLLTSLVVQHQQQSDDGLQELDGLALVSDSAF